MTNKKIILITGKKRSGKDTVANMLQNEIPNSEVMSFAGSMKEILSQVFNISIEQLNYAKDNGKLKSFIKYRRLIFLSIDFRKTLQAFGSEIMKPIFGTSVWISLLLKKINESESDTIIISDWRFLDERIKNAITIKVHVSNLYNVDNHISENELNDVKTDYLIMNNYSLDDLSDKVSNIANEIYLKDIK